MKKILILLCAALLCAGVADAKTKKIAENGGTYSFSIADGASDTSKVVTLDDVAWVADGAGDNDGAYVGTVYFTFTAASTDSFGVQLDYMVGGVVLSTAGSALDAETSGGLGSINLDPGTPVEGFRLRFHNTDVTGTVAATAVKAWLVYKEE